MATAVTPLTWYAQDAEIGQGLNYTYTVWSSATTGSTNMEYPAPPAKLGDQAWGNNSSVWVFVQASASITAGNVIWISPQFKANVMASTSFLVSSFGATQITSDILIGFAQFNNGSPGSILLSTTQVVAKTNDYFWACLGADAGLQVNVGATSCQRGGVVVFHSNVTQGSILTTADNNASVSATNLINLYINTSLDPTTSSTSQTATDCFTIGNVRTTVTTTV
jgi:hypothetical protein